MTLNRLQLYYETLRHLRPVQFYGRLWFRAVQPRPDLRPAPPLAAVAKSEWQLPPQRAQSLFGPDEFCFLGENHSLARIGWDDPAIARLWRYNLHYFDDLNAKEAASRQGLHEALIERWIAGNPPGQGSGWEPYPTSLRIVNWIKWSLAGNELSAAAVHSLAVQTRWLARRLEIHLLGNHLFANAKALVFAGCFFGGPEARRWFERGMRILEREIPEQILPDGGQFELSPMYHALALEDMLDLVNLLRNQVGMSPAHDWIRRIEAMRHWLAALCHPDGEISFFNDAALGIAQSPAALEDYAARLGLPAPLRPPAGCTHLPDSGYVRLQDERATVLVDVAPIGPDYLPGHAHADTLSFELSLGGRRVLVNSGTSVYGDGTERQRQRGTAAHNTVIVDGADSSEVWSGFRVARRARPRDLDLRQEDGTWIIECAHDGYRRLPGRPQHRRTWQFGNGDLKVKDEVCGQHREATAMFHFHPDWKCRLAADGRSGSAEVPGARLSWRVARGRARFAASTFHPYFGATLPSSRLELDLENGAGEILFSWADA